MQLELESVLQPLGITWIILALSTVRNAVQREGAQAAATGFLTLLLWAGGSTPLPSWLLGQLERPFDPTQAAPTPRADAVIMLGGTHNFAPRSPFRLGLVDAADRVVAAVELMRQGKATALVLGGGTYTQDGLTHASSDLLSEWLQRWRLPVGKIHSLGPCANTHDEAVQAAALAAEQRWKKLILVTSGSHLRRAVATFQKAGLDVTPVGAEFPGLDSLDAELRWWVIPRAENLATLGAWVHEELGWWYYRYRGWL